MSASRDLLQCARGARKGRTCWGDQADDYAPSRAAYAHNCGAKVAG